MPLPSGSETDDVAGLRQTKQLGGLFLIGLDTSLTLERHFAQMAGGGAVTSLDRLLQMDTGTGEIAGVK